MWKLKEGSPALGRGGTCFNALWVGFVYMCWWFGFGGFWFGFFFFVGGFGCCFLGHHIAYATHELKEEVAYVTGLP